MIGQVVDRLHQGFPGVPGETVLDVVGAVRGHFVGAPIRDFVPLFVERQARATLARLAVASPLPS